MRICFFSQWIPAASSDLHISRLFAKVSAVAYRLKVFGDIVISESQSRKPASDDNYDSIEARERDDTESLARRLETRILNPALMNGEHVVQIVGLQRSLLEVLDWALQEHLGLVKVVRRKPDGRHKVVFSLKKHVRTCISKWRQNCRAVEVIYNGQNKSRATSSESRLLDKKILKNIKDMTLNDFLDLLAVNEPESLSSHKGYHMNDYYAEQARENSRRKSDAISKHEKMPSAHPRATIEKKSTRSHQIAAKRKHDLCDLEEDELKRMKWAISDNEASDSDFFC